MALHPPCAGGINLASHFAKALLLGRKAATGTGHKGHAPGSAVPALFACLQGDILPSTENGAAAQSQRAALDPEARAIANAARGKLSRAG